MFQSLLSYKKIHFIGIGGSGMSGLAQILLQSGITISGSDKNDSYQLQQLSEQGVNIHIEHRSENLPDDTQAVIYSAAIPLDNPEIISAQKKNLPLFTYPQAIGVLTQQYKTICICGTHGKTTTTGLLASAFIADHQDPTVIVGSTLQELKNKNNRLGKSPYFIVESCEYRRGFLNYHPSVIVITNIEADHLDYFKDFADYQKAFEEFIQKLPKDGLIIANYDDPTVRALTAKSGKKIIYYGHDINANYHLEGHDIFTQKKQVAHLALQIPGEHNRMNAAAALATAAALELNLNNVLTALNSYQGAKRRFEIKGHIGKTLLIDDYAHHPTEIKATLKALRERYGQDKKVLCIFQPHQYSRTYSLFAEFTKAFKDTNEVIIPNILEVRDSKQDLEKVTAQSLVEALNKEGSKARWGGGTLTQTAKLIKPAIDQYDIIITMGAGDVWKVLDELI